MISQIKFKNWRSLQDVTVDIEPLTVFIGANSSGKTSILDALYFVRDIFDSNGWVSPAYARGGLENIQTLGSLTNNPVVIEFSVKLPEYGTLTDTYQMTATNTPFDFYVQHQIAHNGEFILNTDSIQAIKAEDWEMLEHDKTQVDASQYSRNRAITAALGKYISSRWQMLDENFMPYLRRPSSSSNLYVIDPCADNVVSMLDFIKKTNPDVFEQLQQDFKYLLGHVSQVDSQREENETRIVIKEKHFPDDMEAPLVSAGTTRLLAILTAIHILDLRTPETPGLIVIEEPETSIHPGLLKRFVELIRGYSEDQQRQFILTTHNPSFLNYFKPSEVRVVERGDDGYTTVNSIPDQISSIWLDEYSLGDVWLTRAFGAIAE